MKLKIGTETKKLGKSAKDVTTCRHDLGPKLIFMHKYI